MVPLARRLHRVSLGLDQVVDRAGVAVTGAGAIKDLYLQGVETQVVARRARQHLERPGADEDAAVAVLDDLEVQGQDKIAPGLLGIVHAGEAAAEVRVDAALLHRTLALGNAVGLPAVERLAVEQQPPAVRLFLLAQRIIRGLRRRRQRPPTKSSRSQIANA